MQINPEEIVQQIYQALLGREADPSGLERYSQMITQHDGIFHTTRALVTSEEFVYRYESLKIDFKKQDSE